MIAQAYAACGTSPKHHCNDMACPTDGVAVSLATQSAFYAENDRTIDAGPGEDEDAAYVAWQESLPGYAEYAAREDAEAYGRWAEDRRNDGEDDSEDAYVAYLEGFFPED